VTTEQVLDRFTKTEKYTKKDGTTGSRVIIMTGGGAGATVMDGRLHEIHTIWVTAYDKAGNKVRSAPVRIFVKHKDKEPQRPFGAPLGEAQQDAPFIAKTTMAIRPQLAFPPARSHVGEVTAFAPITTVGRGHTKRCTSCGSPAIGDDTPCSSRPNPIDCGRWRWLAGVVRSRRLELTSARTPARYHLPGIVAAQ
jgi:hypothetical protein